MKIPDSKQALNRHERRRAAKIANRANILLADFLSETELSDQLDVGTRTLREWRRTGRGPPYVLISRSVFYRVEAVRSWLLAGEKRPPRERVGRRQAQTTLSL